MTQNSTNSSFFRQTNQVENANPVAANSVEFIPTAVPPALTTNPKRIWIDQLAETLNFTVDGVDIHTIADRLDLGEINVKWFGAVGNNVTIDNAAINAAIAFANSIKSATLIPIVYFPYATGYATNATITVPSGISVIMDGQITYTGAADVTALSIGTASIANKDVTLKLSVERSTLSNWLSESNIGIKLINTSESEVAIFKASRFTLGVQLLGDGTGVVYNNISLYSLVGNKIGVDCHAINNGWCNENNIFGGRFTVSTGQNNGLSRYGVRIRTLAPTYQNNNVFIKPSFELSDTNAAPGEALPILIEQGTQNSFEFIRTENNSQTLARITNDSTENRFLVGFGSQLTNIDDQSNFPAYELEINRRVTLDRDGQTLAVMSNIHKKACYYDGGTSVNVASMFTGTSANANVNKSNSNLVINTDYLEIPAARCIGVFVDTRTVKSLLIRREVLTGFGGRVGIRCYDAAGTILTNAGLGHPYVRSMSFSTFPFDALFGGCYRTSVDTTDDYYIKLGADVAKIAILFTNGTAACRIRGFSLFGLDGHYASVDPGYDETMPGENIATTFPTAGTWFLGRKIWNDTPAAAGKIGWVCTTAGTPGTWKPWGAIDA